MEATIVIELLRDAFSLIEFVQATATTIRNHEEERKDLNLKFRAQTLRLRQFSRFFGGAHEDAAVIVRLEDVPEENLRLVRDFLVKLQRILVEYKNAASKDREYHQNTLPEVADQPPVDEQRPSAATDGQDVVGDLAQNASPSSDSEQKLDMKDMPKPQQQLEEPSKAAKWKMTWMPGWDRISRRRDAKPKAVTDSAGIKTVAKGVEWLFEKDKLEALLVEFTSWNDELQKMIPFVLSGMKNNSDSSLFNMLGRTNDKTDLFAVHVELQQRSPSGNKNNSKSVWVEVQPMAWKKAQSEMSEPRVVVEYKDGPSSDMVYAQQLAWLLQATRDHKFNTLPFKGFAPDPSSARYAFLFDYPEGSTEDLPISLYDVMRSDEPHLRMSLKQRFHVARTVAASIGTFHADNWVHKSIRSHAVQFFFTLKPGATIPVCDFHNPYLTEFESSRPESGQSLFVTAPTVQDIDRDVYLHPDRYSPPKPFIKVYDIYSLGVVLLEIGLWQTAKQIYEKIAPQVQQRDGPGTAVSARAMQQAYLQLARTRLDHRMGTAYREAVEHCLQGTMQQYIGSDRFSMQFQKLILAKVDIERLTHDN
ncbi:hypothetical protein B0T25DRAFT_578437 [Lasiosphaeria hispida]|uniref:Protein kinase domain-containing protein n=1 Tax=Lasiosphaeria hispida TaxID=260671 RepID=A0AAJ0HS95_9PEZI|nr:hypothetical protein B0T25DRAFT_578437 [Lasiosphaeria hispida]